MINIHTDPRKRLLALQTGFSALAIVLLLQVGSRVGEPWVLSGQASSGAGALPAIHYSPSSEPKDDLATGKAGKSAIAQKRKQERSAQSSSSSVHSCSVKNVPGCVAMMEAMAAGDGACMANAVCAAEIEKYLKKTMDCEWETTDVARCEALSRMYWLMQSFVPECKNDAALCASIGTQVTTGFSLTTRACLDSTPCRELLSQFRTGNIACLRYEACRNALTEIRQSSQCKDAWCKNMQKLEAYYAKNALKCPVDSLTCITNDNKAFLAPEDSRSYCQLGTPCWMEMRDLQKRMTSRPDPVCFLWTDCREEMEMTQHWACNTVHREPMCSQYTNLLRLWSTEKPTCIELSYSDSCKQAVNKAVGR